MNDQRSQDRLLWLVLQMIKESKTEGITDEGLSIIRSKGDVRVEGVHVFTDEEVRIAWALLPAKRKFLAEEPGLDCEVIYDTVIIRPFDITSFKKTSLQLPEGALGKAKELSTFFKEIPLQGIVVAVGPGWMTDSGVLRIPGVKIGDHVAMRNVISVADFIYGGKLYYDTKASSVLAIMPERYTNSIKGLKFEDINKK